MSPKVRTAGTDRTDAWRRTRTPMEKGLHTEQHVRTKLSFQADCSRRWGWLCLTREKPSTLPGGHEGVGRTPRVLAVNSTPDSASVSTGRWCPFSEATRQTHQHPSEDLEYDIGLYWLGWNIILLLTFNFYELGNKMKGLF